jgi:hypothetical protein
MRRRRMLRRRGCCSIRRRPWIRWRRCSGSARGMRLTRAIAAGNHLERGHVHALTGAAERIGRGALTVKEAARRLRAPLGDLANPLILGSRREQARALVIAVLNDAPAGLLHEAGRPRAGIAGELNSGAKVSALAGVIAELMGRPVA